CFDTNHNLSEPNAEYIRAVGDRIVTLHVSDYDFIDEKHWFPMDGGIDWRELLSVLEEVNYTGRFTYETMPEGKTYDDLVENYNKLMSL
ncbi:MAG: sugar phosphate isomerase/epimerase, partial [Clostridia bacterium]|nr:sugar phosphate isomerase/epimerase [Clostridia bacterium]